MITMTKDEEEKIGGLHEVLAEIFCHLATVPANRGKIMQAGALKVFPIIFSIHFSLDFGCLDNRKFRKRKEFCGACDRKDRDFR
jgi:hypothetical protein